MGSKYISVILLSIAFSLTGCVSADLETTPKTSAAAVAVNPELAAGQRLVEMMRESPRGYNQIAAYYLKNYRQTGDFEAVRSAESFVTKALAIAPEDAATRKLNAGIHLSFHRFDQALAEATELQKQFPNDPFVYAVLSDANVEMGNYTEAVKAAQTMVDTRPDSASYARASQLRSLHGDSAGAIEMMTLAARTADPADKIAQSWCLVQLGDEHWRIGNYAEAERIYDEALNNAPGYFLGLIAKGKVRASVGDLAAAEQLLGQAQMNIPNANAIHLLADIKMIRGDSEQARTLYDRFDQIQQDLGDGADHKKLILSWANRGKIAEALEAAREEYAAEKNIHSAQLMAWTLYRSGRASEAKPFISEAMRLKTIDARLIFHAGMIAKANGEKKKAKLLLTKALKLNRGFDLREAVEAQAALDEL